MAPFSVLCVCMGNICRSPMAERLLVADLAARGRRRADLALPSHGAGTGGWHAGEPMDPQAARQVLARGGDTEGFRARKLLAEHVDASDLVLTATAEQVDFVVSLRPDAAGQDLRVGAVRPPPAVGDRRPAGRPAVTPTPCTPAGSRWSTWWTRRATRCASEDDLADPWGRPDDVFGIVADQVQALTRPLAKALLSALTVPRSR